MPGKPLTPEQILTLLRESPASIAAVSAGATPAQLRTPPSEGEWSAVEILAHLRACGDMWGDAIRRIVDEDRPAFKATNPRTWMKQTDYPTLEFAPSFAAYREQREEVLALLEGLSDEAWERTATVRVAHATYERTVYYYAEALARHEQPHIKQIARAVEAARRSA